LRQRGKQMRKRYGGSRGGRDSGNRRAGTGAVAGKKRASGGTDSRRKEESKQLIRKAIQS
jgi:hypothetical protein